MAPSTIAPKPAAQHAIAVQRGITTDLGGEDNVSTATKVLIEVVGRNIAFLDETDRRIFKVIGKYPKAKNDPKFLSTLYGYRAPIIDRITKSLIAIGLDKIPVPTKTLEQLLGEVDDDPNADPTAPGEASDASRATDADKTSVANDAERSDTSEGVSASQSESGLEPI